MQVIGFTGHQGLSAEILGPVRDQLGRLLGSAGEALALSSLAGGSDQAFAEIALAAGLSVGVVVPSRGYEGSFGSGSERENYRRLLGLARDVEILDHAEPSEQAYLAAGRRIVDRADRMLAVWDGRPARGVGGTADVVGYARAAGKHVRVIWPAGAER